jgi:hypothetical protein
MMSLDDTHARSYGSPSGAQFARQRHLLVAGTGRAGTSAMVRYLTGLGLETHLSQRGAAASWDDAAQAGLEDIPLSAVTPDLPYVVKSPWSYQFVQELLDDPAIALDGVIVPIRDLVEATSSRVIQQLQAVHQEAPWTTLMATTWEHWGATAGGTIFSLNPIDEARLLAVGFHRLIERLVQADIPIVLVAFPRFATDPDYLHRKLAPLLTADITIAQARDAHAAAFRAANVRVGRELSGADGVASAVVGGLQGPALQALDGAALKREVNRLRGQLNEAVAQGEAFVRERNELANEASRLRSELREATALHDALAQERDALKQERDTIRDQLAIEVGSLRHRLHEAKTQCAAVAQARDGLRDQLEAQMIRTAESELRRTTAEGERDALRERLEHQRDEQARLVQEIFALRVSRSWRATRPLRALGSVLRAGFRR